MASFQYLCEAIAAHNNAHPKAAPDDNKKVAAIKNGLNTRAHNKTGSTFWDDFMQVCGDAESLSHLLGVSKYKIAGWSHMVRKYLKAVEEENQGEEVRKKKRNMVNTGDDNGAANQAMGGDAANPAAPPQAAAQGDAAGPNVFMRS